MKFKYGYFILFLALSIAVLAACAESPADKGRPDKGEHHKQSQKPAAVAERPKTKEIATYPEGVKELNIYRLVASSNLPFSTYIPQEWNTVAIVREYGKGLRLEPPKSNNDYLEVVFLQPDIYRTGAEKIFMNILQEFSKKLQRKIEDSPLGDATVLYYYLNEKPVEADAIIGDAILGEYEGQFFYVLSHFHIERGDGWMPVQNVFFNEWQWREG